MKACADGTVADIEAASARFARHPGDLLLALSAIVRATPAGHLSTRQKKGLCRAFERFGAACIARAIIALPKRDRRVTNYLSVARHAGPNLREAIRLAESGELLPWEQEVERRWQLVRAQNSGCARGCTDETYRQTCVDLVAIYEERPRELLLILPRLANNLVASKLIDEAILAHADDFSAADLVAALTTISAHTTHRLGLSRRHGLYIANSMWDRTRHMSPSILSPHMTVMLAIQKMGNIHENEDAWRGANPEFAQLIREMTRGDGWDQYWARGVYDPGALHDLVKQGIAATSHGWARFYAKRDYNQHVQRLLRERLSEADTPLRGRRVYLDAGGVSLKGSVVLADDDGYAGGPWPAGGIAWELPSFDTVRLGCSWDAGEGSPDATVPFVAITQNEFLVTREGSKVKGWRGRRSSFLYEYGLVEQLETDGQRQHAFLEFELDEAFERGIQLIVMGRPIDAHTFARVETPDLTAGVTADDEVILRDEHPCEGDALGYAVVDVRRGFVRMLRSSDVPLDTVGFSLQEFLFALFDAQGVIEVDSPDEAEVTLTIGPSDDPSVVSLYDNRFFL